MRGEYIYSCTKQKKFGVLQKPKLHTIIYRYPKRITFTDDKKSTKTTSPTVPIEKQWKHATRFKCGKTSTIVLYCIVSYACCSYAKQ